jgi:PAS domain S-box-containing protein
MDSDKSLLKEMNDEVLKLRAELSEATNQIDTLRKELEHRDSIFEVAPNFAAFRFVVDTDYHLRTPPHIRAVVYSSPNFQEISGVANPADPADWFSQIHPDDIEWVLQAQAEMPTSGHFDVVFRSIHCSDNEWRWLHVISQMFYEVDGSPKYINGVVFDVTEEKRAELKMLDYQKRLRDLSQMQYSGEERERRRIAEILHDDVGQDLFLALFKIGQVKDVQAELSPLVDEVTPLLKQALSYIRSISKELCPPALCQMGLKPGLEWLASRLDEQYKVPVKFNAKGDLKGIDDDLGSMIFRITAELLNNVAKHASASKAEVSLEKANDVIRLVVVDDGAGFDDSSNSAHQGDGFGLFLISERLRSSGGSMDIDSNPGEGTRVHIEIPITQKSI